MLARNSTPADAKALDALLNNNEQGDVRIDRDIIVVVGRPVNGCLVWRPCVLVHEFECPGRLTANALVNYAVAQAKARFSDALFTVDPANKRMVKYVESLGAVELTGRLFSLDVG